MERPDSERGGVPPGDEFDSDASFHEYEDAMEESVENTLENHRVNGNGDAEMPDSIHFPHPASGMRGESPTGSGARRILARKCTCWEVSVKAGAVLRRLEVRKPHHA